MFGSVSDKLALITFGDISFLEEDMDTLFLFIFKDSGSFVEMLEVIFLLLEELIEDKISFDELLNKDISFELLRQKLPLFDDESSSSEDGQTLNFFDWVLVRTNISSVGAVSGILIRLRASAFLFNLPGL